jgi:hypothetical protein
MANKSKSLVSDTTRPFTRKSNSWTYGTQDGGRTYGWYIIGSSTSDSPAWPYLEDSRHRSWTTFSGWKAFRDLNGYLPTQSYGDSRTLIRRVGGSALQRHSSGLGYAQELSGNLHWAITPDGFSDSSLTERLVDEAKIECLLKAKDMKVNLPVLFGEGRKTVDLLMETAGKVYGAYRDVRRGRFGKAAERLGIKGPKGAAGNWLSYKYGWLPLLQDVKGLAELAAQQTVGRPPRFTVKSRKTARQVFNSLQSNGVTSSPFSAKNRCSGEVEHVGKAGLLLQVNVGFSPLASQVGITDPALVVWEMVPFSFVFDWFVSVGDWLTVRTALTGLTVLTGFTSTQRDIKGTSTLVDWPNDWTVNVAPVHFYRRSYGRSSWNGSMPLASMAFVNRDPLGVQKMITLFALWKQRSR